MSIFDCFAKLAAEREKTPAEPVSWLIVGLGNPGRDYVDTRHNAGFLALDAIADACGCFAERARFHALTADTRFAGAHVLLMKPQTFMNASGSSVREAAAYYHIEPSHILVLCDDINLDAARLRVRRGGSNGGHRGLGDIIYQLSSDAFPRIRIGVGHKPPAFDLAGYVTGKIPPQELTAIRERFPDIIAGASKIVGGDIDGAMAQCNKSEESK